MNNALAAIMILLVLQAQTIFAQALEVTSGLPLTPESLIEEIFLGEGIDIVNVTYEGNPLSVGYFRNGGEAVNLNQGVLMTTGYAATQTDGFGADATGRAFAGVDNESTAWDMDIRQITAPVPMENISKYTIQFIPRADTLSFRYVFASEEYPLFVCSEFNDVFGFFISGPGINGPYENGGINIAKIPNTDLPVRINTVNGGPPETGNPSPACLPPEGSVEFTHLFNVNRDDGDEQPVYGGFTDVFEAIIPVQACQEYTIKLVIADIQDTNYDSGVFLEARSFASPALQSRLLTTSLNQTIAEGCDSATVVFSLPYLTKNDYDIEVDLLGTAAQEIDYTGIPSRIRIPSGDSSVAITIRAIEDLIPEDTEEIGLDIRTNFCERDTVWIKIVDNTIKDLSLGQDIATCNNREVTLKSNLNAPSQPTTVFINDETLPIEPHNEIITSEIEVTGLPYSTLAPEIIERVCILDLRHPWIDDLDIYLISLGGGQLELTTDNGGDGGDSANRDAYRNTCFTPDATRSISAPGANVPFTGQFLPEGQFDLFEGGPVNGIWQLQIVDDSRGFEGELLSWSIQFNEPYLREYVWSTGSTNDSIIVNPTASDDYGLTVSDSYGCVVKDTVAIQVSDRISVSGLTCMTNSNSEFNYQWQSISGAIAYEISINGGQWINIGDNTNYSFDAQGQEALDFSVRPILQDMTCIPLAQNISCEIPSCNIPSFDVITTPINCANGFGGSVSVKIENGVFLFELGGQTNRSGVFNDLSAGTYELLVHAGPGCFETRTLAIGINNDPPEISFDQTPINCSGGSDGSVSVNVAGSTNNWNINWRGTGQNQTTLEGLSEGKYYLELTNQWGCIALDSVELVAPDPLISRVEVQNPICTGELNGRAQLVAEGGTPPYRYQWDNGEEGFERQNLGSGTYTVTVTDRNGCLSLAEVNVLDPTPLEVIYNIEEPLCHGTTTGRIEPFVSGGLPPYQLNWQNYQTTGVLSNIGAGTYSLQVIDAGGCSVLDSVYLTEPENKALELSVKDGSCIGVQDGAVSVLNAVEWEGYRLNNGDYVTESSFTQLSKGDYTLWAVDDQGCEEEAIFTIEEPSAFTISMADAITVEFGVLSEVPYSITGGTPPFVYNWKTLEQGVLSCQECDNPTITTESRDVLELQVTDSFGCTGSARADVYVNSEWEVMVPTGFTPNSDGINDKLIVHGKPNIAIQSFEVFDRWGELVYLAEDFPVNDESQGWNGSFKGKMLASGTYLWKVNAILPNGQERSFWGSTALIR